MIRDFPLPDLGEGLTESEVVAWRVSVGDRIELNQIVADVETAKAVVELPSPFAGVVTALHAEPGQTVDVGSPLFSCEVGEKAEMVESPGTTDAAGETDVSERSAAAGPALVGYGAAADSAPRRRTRRVGPATGSVPSGDSVAEVHERPRSTPPVRKLARDLGVDLEHVTGTGEHGLITRADVEAAAGAGAMPEASVTSASASSRTDAFPPSTRIPVAGVRRHTAAAMVRSAFTAPHVTEFLTIDVTATMDLVRAIRDDRAFAGHRVTPLAVVAKAVAIAVGRTPEVNARWDDDAHEIIRFEGLNLGIAAATERGLVVPNIKGADRMTLTELADAITALAETARAGRTGPADLAGGTLSITNVGVFGVDAGTPILNPGEAVILATGQVRRLPWEHRGEIALREIMTLSLSFDHRLVDGQQGSRFLADIGAILRDPGIALTMS